MIRPAQYAAADIGTSHNRTRLAVLPALLGPVRSPADVSLLPDGHVPDPGAQGPTPRQGAGIAVLARARTTLSGVH
ncbi:hypothetical protein GCM10011578_098500 [Streptomyces fuscichromogenes]|uniref:Uncharacterized protein n=1 Tax=Streptomyces fuscichromogenes TaxID=1324013 RepID=A0A917XQK8_9ACTN|nr:hypothetical protein GCM10011578_098500 [Streptomyces fuscichromogenes]